MQEDDIIQYFLNDILPSNHLKDFSSRDETLIETKAKSSHFKISTPNMDLCSCQRIDPPHTLILFILQNMIIYLILAR